MLLLIAAAAPSFAAAGSLQMKSGLFLKGDPSEKKALTVDSIKPSSTGIDIYYIWAIDDGLRTYFLSKQQVDAETFEDGRDVGLETFDLPQGLPSTGYAPGQLGAVAQQTPFDSLGQRTIDLATPRGRREVAQGVSEVRPDWLRVESQNLNWAFGLAVSERTDAEIMRLLDAATDRNEAGDRLARVRFLLQADRLALAESELSDAIANFPELAERGETFRRRLSESYGIQAIAELRRRRDAGQHELVQRLIGAFDPARVTPSTFGQADAIAREYRETADRIARVRLALESLEGELSPELRARVAPVRRRIADDITFDTIDRLVPFDESIEDIGLTAEQKLAIAYSGFAAGEGQLVETLDEALQIVALRRAVSDALAARDDYTFEQAAADVENREGATVPLVKAILKRLPPVDPLPSGEESADETQPGGRRVEVDVQPLRTNTPGRLTLQLPPEASGDHKAPLLVVLCERADEVDAVLNFWAGSPASPGFAQRYGMATLAIAPTVDRTGRDPMDSRDVVLDAIRTAKRRVAIDSDRVFLAGHRIGGAMALELGFSRPYDWAGVLAVCSVIPTPVRPYDEQADDLSVYLVTGELDGGTLAEQVSTLEDLLLKRRDVLVCEYRGRGLERYGAERERMFEWMALHRRPPIRRYWDVRVSDGHHGEWDWLRTENWGNTPRRLKARLSEANSIFVSTGRLDGEVWIPGELIQLDDRVKVSLNGRRSSVLIDRSVRATLEDAWRRADSERLYDAKLEF